MVIDQRARQDFDWAMFKAFWRKILAWLTGESNELLPFDEVRARLPIKGQHYLGLQQVSLDKIIGSQGRYLDFDRAFLPLQSRSKERWISISRARYQDITLPPVDLYKLGDIYFVRDGNHRVSVAHERGQEFIDAYVVEIDIPIPLTPEMVIDDLELKRSYASFIEHTGFDKLKPEPHFDVTFPEQFDRLLDHIITHRWYLGEQQGAEIPFEDAALSWYNTVYLPLIEIIREQKILKTIRRLKETDLYIWVIEFQWYLRKARDDAAVNQAAQQFADKHPYKPISKLVNVLRHADWLDELTLKQERSMFLERTQLQILRPEANVIPTLPGQYQLLLEHIDTHRWYLGEQLGAEVPYEQAVVSWFDQVYLPLAEIIREQGILKHLPNRTEADLYLWIISHQWYLREVFRSDVTLQEAAERFIEDVMGNKGSKKSPGT